MQAPGTSYEDYSTADIVAEVMDATGGEGVKCVIDGIGLNTWEISLNSLVSPLLPCFTLSHDVPVALLGAIPIPRSRPLGLAQHSTARQQPPEMITNHRPQGCMCLVSISVSSAQFYPLLRRCLSLWFGTTATRQARRGIFVSFGNASGAVPAFPPLKLIGKSAFLTRPKLNDYTVTRGELLERADDIFGWLQDGRLKVTVDRAFKLDDVQEGHKYLEAGKSKGKVLYSI